MENIRCYKGREEVLKWGWKTFRKIGFVYLQFYKRDMVIPNFTSGIELCEDVIWSLGAMARCQRVCSVDFKGYFYRQWNGSSIHKSISSYCALKYMENIQNLFREQILAIIKYNTKEVMRDELMRGCWFILYNWAVNPRDYEYSKEIHKAFKEAYRLSEKKLPQWSVFPAIIYLLTGRLYPIRLVLSMIKLKAHFK